MNNIYSKKMLQKIQLIYSELNPLTPDDLITKISEELATFAKRIINLNSKKEKHIAIGYYSANINIDIRNFASNPDNDILFINALLYEFISDFLLFAKTRDIDHFTYFFSKYMRNFEKANGNDEAARFYNWIYKQYKQNYHFNHQQYIMLAGEGLIFLILHEFIHTQNEQIDNTINLFHTPPTDEYFNHLSDSNTLEVACDFSALAYIDKLKLIEKTSPHSKNELLEVFFLEIFSIGIYSTFHHFLNNSINNPNLEIPNILSKLIDITVNRYHHLSLALKVAQNSNMFFCDVDISSTIANVNETIQKYLLYTSDFLRNNLLIKIDEYNSLPEKTKKEYTYNSSNAVWKLFI